jgi:2-polyprenyl-3-methyl-5-hydroxy-6-metoxy-1,4-benzoquinol methylase
MGSELDDKNKSLIEKIPAVQKLHVGGLDNLDDQFDVISFIHVLEHIPSPAPLLESLHNKFKPNGVLLIQVPYFIDNPFDLIIADHCSHFTPETLSKIVQDAGYNISLLRTDIITKEITLVASCSITSAPPIHHTDKKNTHTFDKDDAVKALQFYFSLINKARDPKFFNHEKPKNRINSDIS